MEMIVTSVMAHDCGDFSGMTLSCEMVIIVPSLRMVMMTSESTGSTKAERCSRSGLSAVCSASP